MAHPDELVDSLLAAPPAVHAMDASTDPAFGVLATTEDCYRFLAERVTAGTRTLETGSGLSTVLFAGLGARHQCVTPLQGEADRLLNYCADRTIDTSQLTFHIGGSHEVLPGLTEELDLVLVDGGHGFPVPILDWFYAGSLLRQGGTLVIDDLQLPAVRVLKSFLDPDPRWQLLNETPKWAAYERRTTGHICEDWWEQPFFTVRERVLVRVARPGAGALRRLRVRRRGTPEG